MPEQGTDGEGTPQRSAPTDTPTLGWARAGLVGAGVFAYFGLATTWLPSALLRLGAVASSSQWIRDAVATGSWLAALSVGLVGLRWAQARGWI